MALVRGDLPAANIQAVYQRMRTEREREAADLRANGQQQAQTIRARAWVIGPEAERSTLGTEITSAPGSMFNYLNRVADGLGTGRP